MTENTAHFKRQICCDSCAPSHAAQARCAAARSIAYIRNDCVTRRLATRLRIRASGTVQHYSQLSPDQQVALRQTTHLRTPDPVRLTCDGVPCGSTSAAHIQPRVRIYLQLASEAFRCGESSVDPCRGCRDALSFVSKLCDGASVNRSNFCASPSPNAPGQTRRPPSTPPTARLGRHLIAPPVSCAHLNAGAHRVPMETYSR